MTKKVAFRPTTFIITLSNVICFMSLQTLFFWYIVSKSVEQTIDNKTVLVKELADGIPELAKNIEIYAKSEVYEHVKQNALEHRKMRDEYNLELIWKWMIVPYSTIIIGLSMSTLMELYFSIRKNNAPFRFDRVDALILCSVFMAFSTELVFYYVVISRSRNISDMDVLQILTGIVGAKFEENLPTNG